jgi:surfeit locus 1 family protein
MAGSDSAAAPAPVRRKGFSLLLAVLALLLIVLFCGSGDLAGVPPAVETGPDRPRGCTRARRPGAPPPRRAGRASKAVRRIPSPRTAGTYLYEYTTPVQALTEQGAATGCSRPCARTDGNIVIVNRGFIPAVLGSRTRYDRAAPAADPCAAAGGHAARAWSACCASASRTAASCAPTIPPTTAGTARDVAAIAAARGLATSRHTSSTPPPARTRPIRPTTHRRPHGHQLPNSHLVYAITWYALALMVPAPGGGCARRRRPRHENRAESLI